MKRSNAQGWGAENLGIHKTFAAMVVLAAGGAASLPAHAQGQLTVFGTVDVYAGHGSQGPRSWTRLESGGNAESRLGFRGTEDLGGGVSARFMLEAGFNTDTGGDASGTLSFARQSWVALAGPAGSVQLGRTYTPMFQAMARADPFALNTVFSPMNMGASPFPAAAATAPALRPFAARASNMLRYRTPAANGLFADAAYAFAESASGDQRSGEVYGGALGWDRGPLYAAYAFQGTRFSAAATAANPVPAPVITRYQALTAAYRASESVQVFAIVSHTGSSDDAIKSARVASAGAAWNVAPASRLLFSAAQRKTLSERASRIAWTLGYDHALSRRTVLYGRILGTGSHGTPATAAAAVAPSARLLAVGMRHTF